MSIGITERLLAPELEFLLEIEELQEEKIFEAEPLLCLERVFDMVGKMDLSQGVLQIRKIVLCEDLFRDPFLKLRIALHRHADREPDAARGEALGFGIYRDEAAGMDGVRIRPYDLVRGIVKIDLVFFGKDILPAKFATRPVWSVCAI